MPGWGLSQKLSRMIGISRAKELSFSGNFLDAHTAERWGLVNRVYESDELVPAAMKLAQDVTLRRCCEMWLLATVQLLPLHWLPAEDPATNPSPAAY